MGDTLKATNVYVGGSKASYSEKVDLDAISESVTPYRSATTNVVLVDDPYFKMQILGAGAGST